MKNGIMMGVLAVAAMAGAAERRNLQAEIDAVAQKGGGVVRVPAGEWLTPGVRLRDNVTLELAEGAKLVATTNLAEYASRTAFIYAEDASHVALVGKGTVYGSGDQFEIRDAAPNRPMGVVFRNCRDFRVEGVRLEAPAAWTLRLFGCVGGVVRGVRIFSHVNFNNDGIDIEASNLLVEDCDIDSDDDALCFKSDLVDFTVENVEVRNCRLSSNCNAIKFGTGWVGKGRNIRVHDCTIRPLVNSRLRRWHEARTPGGVPDAPQCLGGIVLESVDGGWLEDVTVRNITMEGVQTPIVIREAARRVNPNRETRLRNILIENVKGTALSRIASSITGIYDGKRPQNVTLRNVDLTLPGGATAAMRPDRWVPEVPKSYPENRMFGHILPAWGLYIRHADGVTLDNVKLRLSGEDVRRDAVVADDVTDLVCTDCNFTPAFRDDERPSVYVDPFIGTEGTANCFPNACVPFGIVQNGPCSGTYEWKYCGGYHFEDRKLYGFVQDGISGTGCADNGDLLIQPFSGRPEDDEFRALKGEETASPGFYSVRYPKSGITARGTCAEHTAFWNFAFDRTEDAHLMLDLQWGHTTRRDFAHRIKACEVEFPDDHTMTGHLRITQWVARDLYFCIRFNRAVKSRKIASRSKGLGDRYVFDVAFAPGTGRNLDVKIALSANSVAAAKANMASEIPHWHFAEASEAAEAKWHSFFSRMKVRGTFEEKRNFYTAMWHLGIAPNNVADVGEKPFYSTLSYWDTFRAAHPLFTILTPERVTDMVNSSLRYYDANGFMPIWALWGKDNMCMIGTHSIPVAVDAYLKGFTGVDWERLYQASKRTVTTETPGRVKGNFDLIDRYGYYPCDIIRGESVSRLLECAYDDWCLAKLAEGLGHADDAAYFLKRSENWRNVFDKSLGLVRGKRSDGSWRTPFNPAEFGHGAENDNDFTEGNSWQYTWHVMQNPLGLIDAFGSRERFVRQLDKLFTINDELVGGGKRHDISGLIGQYVHGNEPSHHVVYFYPFAGEPRKTAEKVREVCDRFYRNGPYGLSGNDDCGQMSAWYLFSVMGFYPFNPCGGDYVIGAPQLPEVQVKVRGEGEQWRTFTVVAKGLSKENKYVKSVTLNGKPLDGFILKHTDVMRGGELVFEMVK